MRGCDWAVPNAVCSIHTVVYCMDLQLKWLFSSVVLACAALYVFAVLFYFITLSMEG